jgi:hypothetical protein
VDLEGVEQSLLDFVVAQEQQVLIVLVAVMEAAVEVHIYLAS